MTPGFKSADEAMKRQLMPILRRKYDAKKDREVFDPLASSYMLIIDAMKTGVVGSGNRRISPAGRNADA